MIKLLLQLHLASLYFLETKIKYLLLCNCTKVYCITCLIHVISFISHHPFSIHLIPVSLSLILPIILSLPSPFTFHHPSSSPFPSLSRALFRAHQISLQRESSNKDKQYLSRYNFLSYFPFQHNILKQTLLFPIQNDRQFSQRPLFLIWCVSSFSISFSLKNTVSLSVPSEIW